jgi:hypothetical protein
MQLMGQSDEPSMLPPSIEPPRPEPVAGPARHPEPPAPTLGQEVTEALVEGLTSVADVLGTPLAECPLSDDPYPNIMGLVQDVEAGDVERPPQLTVAMAAGHTASFFGDAGDAESLAGHVVFSGFARAEFSLRREGEHWSCEHEVVLVPADRLIRGVVKGVSGDILSGSVRGTCGFSVLSEDGSFELEASRDACTLQASVLVDDPPRRIKFMKLMVAASDDLETEVTLRPWPGSNPGFIPR